MGSAIWTADYPVTCFERMQDVIPFYLRKPTDWQIGFLMRAKRLQFSDWGSQYSVRRKDHCSLNKVLQFPNVSGPAVSHQGIHRIWGDIVKLLVHFSRVQSGEVPYQFRNVFRALPEGRNVDRKYFQPIVKVLAKCSLLYHRCQIAMRGGDQADVDFVRAVASESIELLFLQDA